MAAESNQNARKTVFFHVPKTGGATFRDIMASIYGDRFHFCLEESRAGVEADIAAYDCTELHIFAREKDWFYPHAALIEQGRMDVLANCNNFIMFRDPVDHYLSQYYYAVGIRHRMEPIMQAAGLKFPESLEEQMDDPASYNNQTAFILGKLQIHGKSLLPEEITEARKMLIDLPFRVGLTERFGDSMHVFEKITGKTSPWHLVKRRNYNATRPRLHDVPAAVRDVIRERSALDVELYSFGRELFEKDMAEHGANPGYSFASPPTESEAALTGAAKAAAGRATAYLIDSQTPEGAFRTTILANRYVVEGQLVGDPKSFKCPFTSSLVLYSLQSALDLDDNAPATLQRGLQWLRSEMNPGGLWSFWAHDNPKRAITPPDLDDTACISHLLQTHGIEFPDNRALLYDTRDSRGAFLLWMYKADSWRKWKLFLQTGGKAFAHRKDLWYEYRDAVCAPVVANCVMYLGETAGTRGAIDYLLQIFRDNTEAKETLYYTHHMSLYYMASRAYASGVTALEEAKPIMAERILGMQRLNGGFGDELLTGQAICSLLNLGLRPEKLADAVAYLIATQRENGAWKRVIAFGGPPTPVGFGSEDLTTAFCLEALARYTSAGAA